jgi:hypothetical protein
MPIRRIPLQTRSQAGLFWSLKNGRRHVAYESALEHDLCVLLEFDELVVAFESQPLEIRYIRPSGRACKGIPDFLVEYNSPSGKRYELYDVKYRSEIRENWPELRIRFRAAARHARENGWIFRLKDEHRIRGDRLTNGKRLLRFLRDEPDQKHERHLLGVLQELENATPQLLFQAAYSSDSARSEAQQSMWRLLARREICCDLNLPLSMHSRIWLNS